MRSVMLVLLVSLLAAPATGDMIVEEKSGIEFPSVLALPGPDGAIQLDALGTGIRTKFRFKVYAACFYAEKGADLGEEPCEAAIRGDFAKRIVMHFLRDVDAEKIAGAYRDGIRKTLDEGHDEAIEGFCGLFTEKVLEGQTIVLTQLPGKGVLAEQDGQKLGILEDGKVIAALWATWFGEKPISGKLKKGLLGQ